METPPPWVYNKADNESNERPPTFGLNSFESTLSDFQTLFATNDLTKPENVFAQSLAGTLKNYHCRSIAWKVFLGYLDAGKAPAEWVQQITAKRMEYEALLKQHKTDPNNTSLSPLSKIGEKAKPHRDSLSNCAAEGCRLPGCSADSVGKNLAVPLAAFPPTAARPPPPRPPPCRGTPLTTDPSSEARRRRLAAAAACAAAVPHSPMLLPEYGD